MSALSLLRAGMLSQKPASLSSRSTSPKTCCVSDTSDEIPSSSGSVSPKMSLFQRSEEGHLFLAMQPIGGLLVRVGDALTKLFQLFVNSVPVVLKLFENRLQCFSKGSLKVGIIIEINFQVMPDGVFDLGGFRLCPVSAVDLFLEILVQDRD